MLGKRQAYRLEKATMTHCFTQLIVAYIGWTFPI